MVLRNGRTNLTKSSLILSPVLDSCNRSIHLALSFIYSHFKAYLQSDFFSNSPLSQSQTGHLDSVSVTSLGFELIKQLMLIHIIYRFTKNRQNKIGKRPCKFFSLQFSSISEPTVQYAHCSLSSWFWLTGVKSDMLCILRLISAHYTWLFVLM